MKFSVRVCYKGLPHKAWVEQYDSRDIQTEEQAQAWAKSTIAEFNTGLRPEERERELLEVTMLGPSQGPWKHEWEKTNLVTIMPDDPNLRPYDTYRCSRCGSTGKRFGLDPQITLDRNMPSACS